MSPEAVIVPAGPVAAPDPTARYPDSVKFEPAESP